MSFDYWKTYFDVDVDMLQDRYLRFMDPRDQTIG